MQANEIDQEDSSWLPHAEQGELRGDQAEKDDVPKQEVLRRQQHDDLKELDNDDSWLSWAEKGEVPLENYEVPMP